MAGILSIHNPFSLYARVPDNTTVDEYDRVAMVATLEGQKIINDFLYAWRIWQLKFRRFGAADTACKDAFLASLRDGIEGR